jgi:hypothetical protein
MHAGADKHVALGGKNMLKMLHFLQQ